MNIFLKIIDLKLTPIVILELLEKYIQANKSNNIEENHK